MPILTPQIAAENGITLADFGKFDAISWPFDVDAGAASSNPTWGFDQITAIDAMQRHATQVIGQTHGIPLISGQAAAQFSFLSSDPVGAVTSAALKRFAELLPSGFVDALDAALDLALGLAFDAIQGAVGASLQIVGAIPIAGWISKVVFALIEGAIALSQALQGGHWTALEVSRPVYDPAQDASDTRVATLTAASRDWTGLFSPGDSGLGLSANLTMGSLGVTNYPTFAGRKTPAPGEWYFAQFGVDFLVQPTTFDHFGFVPPWNGDGGRLWRGVLVDKNRVRKFRSSAAGTELVGDMRPTAQAALLSLWGAVQNPYAPQVWFVDARRLEVEWRNYLIQLRKGLHVSHLKAAKKGLEDKDPDRTYGEGVAQKRMWLTFAELSRGDLEKKKNLRRAVCNALVPVFGWRPWQAGEDSQVGEFSDVAARSADQYADLYGIDQSAPIQACRALHARQLAAAWTVGALYSMPDDPAIASDQAMRSRRNRAINYAMSNPNALALADRDMIPDEVWKQAAGQFWQPGSGPAGNRAIVSQTFRIADVWTGDGPPPSAWPGKPPRTLPKNPPGLSSSGGGGAQAIAAAGITAAAVAAFGMLR